MTKTDQNDVSEEALKERSYLWMARAFGLICVVTLIADIILFTALNSLQPLVRVQPFYITTQDKDRQIVNIVRPNTATLSSRVLQESFVRQYLVARLGIGTDVEELKRRWGINGTIQWMSETSVYNTFLRDFATNLIKMAEEEGLTRDVNILNTRLIPREDGKIYWQAEVQLIDLTRSAPDRQVVEWTIDMTIQFGRLGNNIQWGERLQNPLGFMVTSYAQKIRK